MTKKQDEVQPAETTEGQPLTEHQEADASVPGMMEQQAAAQHQAMNEPAPQQFQEEQAQTVQEQEPQTEAEAEAQQPRSITGEPPQTA